MNPINFPQGVNVVVIDSTSPYFEKKGKVLYHIAEFIIVQFSEEEIVEIPYYQICLAD